MRNTKVSWLKIRNYWILLIILWTVLAHSSVSYRFSFHPPQKKAFDVIIEDQDWNSAFERASQICVNRLTRSEGNKKIRVNEQMANNLIDTCLNPKSQKLK